MTNKIEAVTDLMNWYLSRCDPSVTDDLDQNLMDYDAMKMQITDEDIKKYGVTPELLSVIVARESNKQYAFEFVTKN